MTHTLLPSVAFLAGRLSTRNVCVIFTTSYIEEIQTQQEPQVFLLCSIILSPFAVLCLSLPHFIVHLHLYFDFMCN